MGKRHRAQEPKTAGLAHVFKNLTARKKEKTVA